jgi:hypothetical protein
VVNEREAQINAAADNLTTLEQPPLQPVFQGKAPEATAPAGETPVAATVASNDIQEQINKLAFDQLEHNEGSAEWNAIQADIDALKKPAEEAAPAQTREQRASQKWKEVQSHPEGSPEFNKAFSEYADILNEKPAEAPVAEAPTEEPKNAIQEPSTTEAMLRPQVTGQGKVVELSGVGEQKPEVSAKEAEAPKEEVVVPASLEEAKTPEEVDAFVKAERQRLAQMLPTNTSNEAVNIRNKVDLGKRSKALGMEAAAKKRQLTGNLTAKEQAAKDKREASNYVGKPVSVEGRNGTIIGNPFGRVKVRFSDGTESTHLTEKIEAPVAEPEKQPSGKVEPQKPQRFDQKYINGIKPIAERMFESDPSYKEAYEKATGEKLTDKQAVDISIEMLQQARESGQMMLINDAVNGADPDIRRAWDQIKKTQPEKSSLETWADNTIKESKKRLNVGLDPEVLSAYAVKGAFKIARGVRDFGEWSKQMLEDFGENIRPHLQDLWSQAKEIHAQRDKYAPKAPTEQEAFAKKAADAILKGRGTPITQDELANILARKFPGISPSEVGDLYATAFGKPKAPTPYAGVAATTGETPEKISIRAKDQEDQVRRGILTSTVPAGEGMSKQEITDQGNANLQNGADPYQALERAKQGDRNALITANAYSKALAKRVSDALKKFGPESKEYKDLAKQYQDYYEGIREAATTASDILRTFQGETDLSDAADIAREYTKITGEEPSLGKHEQIRKVADKVDKTIKESGEATQKVRDTLDESLSDVEVKTPESVEESQQQIADLSDAAGKKSKEEIERLNNELEQTKRDLEEVRKAKETGQDAESLRKYYEAKLKDLNDQLESQPKYGKEVFETAKKIVDKWKADAAEAEKLLRKQLNQMGSSPDPTIILTLARIMRAHIGELALDFTKSSAMLVEKFGPKIKPFLKDAWAKAQELIKGEDGGEKAVKSVRKGTAKAKSVEKMTPAEKAAESLRKRISQAQKKIDDLNSGKVTTPKEVEKVTNDEIKRLESEYEQKKKDLADARLKAKQRDLFDKDKIGENLNPEQVKTLWETAKKFYLDKGEQDWDKMVNDLASDLGLTPDQVRKGLASPKGARKASDEMYLKQRSRQIALDEAKRWLTNQKASWIGRVFGAAAEKTFKLAIFGHGTAFIGTHAPSTLYTNPKLAFKAWLKGLSYSFRGKNGRIQNIVDNKDLIYRPNWTVARRAGLENDPRETRREGATPARSDTALAKALDTISGGRGFDALFHLRQDMFDQAWDQLSVTMRTPEMAEILADSINNATGFTKGGERTKGILQSPITKILFFAPKLIASRFKWLVQDPAKMLGTVAKMANPFTKVTPEERMSAIYEAKNKAKFLGMVTGTLLANQALLSVAGSNQSINFTDPKKNDWLAYKGFGYTLATIGAFTRIARLLAQEYNAVFGDLNRIQKARGGREAAMKDAIYTYLRSGFSPITRDIIVGATGKDYLGNTVPWSDEKPDRGRRKLTWSEIIQEQFAPIPISEAATQGEGLFGIPGLNVPGGVKAGSAAFLGTRLETPRDIEEYEKSLKSRTRSSSKSNKVLGGGSSRSSGSSGLIK